MREPRWPLVVGIVVGAVCTAVGVGAAVDSSKPVVLAQWMVGLTLAHDLVLAPLVLFAGLGTRRRPWLAGGLLVSGVVVLVAFPFVQGYGRLPGNPSFLPRDYTRGLVLTLVAVWLATAAVAWWSGRG